MEKIRILCYGDSNTWGHIPGTEHDRYDNRSRWTALLQNKLGEEFEVISEGLCARTLDSDDDRWAFGNANGEKFFGVAVYSHDPLDFIVIMLGTNELKDVFNRSAQSIAAALEKKYIKYLKEQLSETLIKQPKIIIVAPPVIKGELYKGKSSFLKGNDKSKQLNQLYEQLAIQNNCLFVDNNDLDVGCDGLHMTKQSHNVLANKIAKCISDNLQ